MSSPAQTSGHSPETDTSLANRYGRPKRRLSKRGAVIAVIAGLVVLLALTLFMTLSSHRSYSPTDVSFDVVSARRTDVTVAVTMKPGDTITCGVQVLDEDHGVVGYQTVDFPSSEGDSDGGGNVVVQRTVPIRTVYVGVNGGASVCWDH